MLGILDSRGNSRDIRSVAEVGADRLDIDARIGMQSLRRGRQAVRVACDEHEVVSGGSQLAGEFGTDAGCAARDESRCHGGYITLRAP